MKKSTFLYCLPFLIIPFALLKNALHDNIVQANNLKPFSADYSKESGLAKIVSLEEAFKATLSNEQAALLQREYF